MDVALLYSYGGIVFRNYTVARSLRKAMLLCHIIACEGPKQDRRGPCERKGRRQDGSRGEMRRGEVKKRCGETNLGEERLGDRNGGD